MTTNFNKFKMQADNNGHFSSTIVDVPANTVYYVRSYGINAQGVGYGNEVKFTSPADKILPGNGPIVLTTQQEVNTFGTNNYTTITNGIEINGNSVTDLTPLKSIVILGGGLEIKNTSLQNLRGLDSLEIIGYNFFNSSSIEYNPLLKDLSGLNKLKTIRGNLQIVRNNAMENLTGLNSLSLLHGGSFGIYECNRLQNLDALEKLVFVDGDVVVQNNPALTNLRGLRNVQTIIGNVRITGSTLLTNIEGFEKIKNLTLLDVRNNPILTSLNGFRNLVTLNSLNLDNNAELSDLSAIRNLKTLQTLNISRSNSVSNLTAFSNLETITEKLTVSFNPNLISLKGLEKLQQAKSIQISYNNSLLNLKGLDSLTTIFGSSYSLSVSSNPALTSLIGIENLRTVQGQVYMENNSPQLNYCALKPFLLQYTGNQFILISNGVSITRSQIIASCP